MYMLNELFGSSVIVFTATCAAAMKTAMLLRQLGMQVSIVRHPRTIGGSARNLLDIADFDSEIEGNRLQTRDLIRGYSEMTAMLLRQLGM